MKINNRLFPYPILSGDTDDYLTGFNTNIRPETNKSGFKLKVKNYLTDKIVKNLIDTNKAIFAVHLECKDTRFRKVYKKSSDEFTIDIEKDLVLNNLEYCSMILATEDIPLYQNEFLNEDLREFTYSFSKGDIIAIGGNGDMPIINEDSLLSTGSSIVSIVKDEEKDYIDYLLGPQKICILLPPDVHNYYNKARQYPESKHILITSIVLPVLSSILDDIKDDEMRSELESYNWFISMTKWLGELGYKSDEDILKENSIVIAQKLLEKPYERFFNSFDDILINGYKG